MTTVNVSGFGSRDGEYRPVKGPIEIAPGRLKIIIEDEGGRRYDFIWDAVDRRWVVAFGEVVDE